VEKDLLVKGGILIFGHELEVVASRASGPGGQHVNKTSTRITVRWNVPTTKALSAMQKERILQKLAGRLTNEGDIIIHSSSSRSQRQNKEDALGRLSNTVYKALHVQKKRMKTRVPRSAKEARLKSKSHRGQVKKLRSKKISND
jgi:ribosome-associated protein